MVISTSSFAGSIRSVSVVICDSSATGGLRGIDMLVAYSLETAWLGATCEGASGRLQDGMQQTNAAKAAQAVKDRRALGKRSGGVTVEHIPFP